MDATRDDNLMNALRDATDDQRLPSLDLLRTLLDRQKVINRKHLCALFGVGPATIGHMLAGRVHISIERWAVLFDDLRDERILRLMIDLNHFAVYALPEPCDLGTTDGLSQAFIRLESSHHKMAVYVERMLSILGDMRVDGDDGELVQDLKTELPDLIAAMLAGASHVLHLYERWCQRQQSGVAGSIGKAVKR